jgi:hypothetical protein
VEDPETLLLDWDRGYALYQGLVDLVQAADRYAGDDAEPSLQAAFELGNEGIHEGDAVKVGGARQVIEKTLFRALHNGLLAAAEAAYAPANPRPSHFRAQRRSLGLLGALEDRMLGRNTQGLVETERMLRRPPTEVDPETLAHALFVNWAKRTYRYTFHGLEDTAALGTPAAVIGAIEGKTYYRLVASDLAAKVEGADIDATLRVWDEWAEAIGASDLQRATLASETLQSQLCAYQSSLGIVPCTASEDEAPTTPTLLAHLDPSSSDAQAVALAADLLVALDAGDGPLAGMTWEGDLEAWATAKDAELGTGFAAAVKALLAQEDPPSLDLVAAKWKLVHLLLEAFKAESKSLVVDQVGGVGSVEAQLLAWDVCFSYFHSALRTLAQEADAFAEDTTEADILRGFELVSVGVQDGDPRIAGAGRQIVEKTLFRVLYHQVRLHARAARDGDSPEDAGAALGALLAIADRVETKVSAEKWADVLAQLDGSTQPSSIDFALVEEAMLEAFAQRTFNYTRHAEMNPEAYGTPAGYAQAVEGHTYFQLIRADLLERLDADGAAWERQWQRWISAIETGDVARGKAASTFLASETEGVCAYELALGMSECR